MKVLLVVPEIRLNDKPFEFPFWSGILASIVENKGGDVAILDLNALRMNYGGGNVPTDVIKEEISSENWDLIGVGGLTTTYKRLKQLIPLIHKISPNSILIAGGGWCSYNPDEILELIPEINMICIGEGEETFSEVYDEIKNKTLNFEKVKGLCINDNENSKFTEPRALISDLDSVPTPHYDLFETDIYFKYSSYPYLSVA